MSSGSADPPSHLVSLSATAPATPGVGLGYGIAIAVSILVLISTIMLASYACVRVKSSLFSSSYVDTRAAVNPASDLPVVVVSGLDEKSIESYPKRVLGESRRLPEEPNNSNSCSICLGEYRAKDVVRSIPGCRHCFHAECVDAWLRVSATCPLCRSFQAPTPLGTPLSELVPLASHPR